MSWLGGGESLILGPGAASERPLVRFPYRRCYHRSLSPQPSFSERAGVDENSLQDSVWLALAHFPALYSPEGAAS